MEKTNLCYNCAYELLVSLGTCSVFCLLLVLCISSMQAFLSLVYNRQMSMILDHIWSASSDVTNFLNKLNQYVMPLYREINDILTLYYRIE